MTENSVLKVSFSSTIIVVKFYSDDLSPDELRNGPGHSPSIIKKGSDQNAVSPPSQKKGRKGGNKSGGFWSGFKEIFTKEKKDKSDPQLLAVRPSQNLTNGTPGAENISHQFSVPRQANTLPAHSSLPNQRTASPANQSISSSTSSSTNQSRGKKTKTTPKSGKWRKPKETKATINDSSK